SIKHVPALICCVQAPPTHTPVVHESASLGHSPSGSVPSFTLEQTPLANPFLARLHALHADVHAVLQQTPSAPKRDVHCAGSVQVAPSASFAMQTPPMQRVPATHSPSCAQLVGQLPPFVPQTYGEHDGDPAPVTSVHAPFIGAPSAAE